MSMQDVLEQIRSLLKKERGADFCNFQRNSAGIVKKAEF